ncbi:hypothetical protein WJX72_001435 [[Myrmecia] bisecta]|uniref:N-alpha-acetyltransferase 60 n=1 Tax=[Myrmecia] bisecta TaxID=41462 RepID=A0AAW1QP42_9CHLO
MTSSLTYRPLCPEDYHELREAHQELFPINYDEGFYYRAVNSLDGIYSWAAFTRTTVARQEKVTLVGFVTARLVHLHSCDASDRGLMGLSSRLMDQELVVYILTLGVVNGYRQMGVASQLVNLVLGTAGEKGVRAVYLHVVTYNQPAIRFYERNRFQQAALLRDFYMIATGRQPDPQRTVYDAYLYVHYLDSSVPVTPYSMLNAAVAPLRNAAWHLNACMPWASRQGPGYFGDYESSGALPQKPGSSRGSAHHSQQQREQVSPWLSRLFSRS